MLERTRYEKMFATPLMRFRVPGHEALDAELLGLCARLRADRPGVRKSNRGGWHSTGNLFKTDEHCIRVLKALAEMSVLEITREIAPKLDVEALRMSLFGWMNANPPGGFNAPHTHPGAHWSGVYYVSQPAIEDGDSGKIEFLDPRSDLPNWRLLDAPPFRPKRSFRPAAGEIVLFPSYLMHWVYPNESGEERVSVAFNATFSEAKEDGSDPPAALPLA